MVVSRFWSFIFAFTLFCGTESTDNELVKTTEMELFDFTKNISLSNWSECSDTVRSVGMSKAVLVLQTTQIFQRGVFFTMLNPQPNGAGFAGVNTNTNWDLKNYEKIMLKVRGQGENYHYKIVLRHKGLNHEPNPTYEHFFEVPKQEIVHVNLTLNNFEPYYRGRKLNSSEAEPLDVSQITSFGLQVYGGVYLPIKQGGTSSLEIDWVHAV